jgi:hypothetical protein
MKAVSRYQILAQRIQGFYTQLAKILCKKFMYGLINYKNNLPGFNIPERVKDKIIYILIKKFVTFP